VRALRIQASSNASPGKRPAVPLTSLVPEDGFRMDAIKSDFKTRFGYELDNKRLGGSYCMFLFTRLLCLVRWEPCCKTRCGYELDDKRIGGSCCMPSCSRYLP